MCVFSPHQIIDCIETTLRVFPHFVEVSDRNVAHIHVVNRSFDRLKAAYGRALASVLAHRTPIYAAWAVVAVLALLMFSQSPKELAPTEDQGVIFGIVNTPANSTLQQVTQSTHAINETVMKTPETQFTFQITFPTGGFWGDGLKPWTERKRSAAQILPEIFGKVSAIPGVQTFAVLPPALPGGGNFPVEFILASTAEPSEILGFAQKLQQKAATSGMLANALTRSASRPTRK